MFYKILTGILVASTVLSGTQTGHEYSKTVDATVKMHSLASTSAVSLELLDSDMDDPLDSLELWIEEKETALAEGRDAIQTALEAAEKAAEKARAYADKTDGQEIEDAAEAAEEAVEKAKDASEIAADAEDTDVMDMAVESAETAQAEAETAAEEAKEGAKAEKKAKKAAEEAEAARKEAEMMAKAEYLGNFTLTAYCHCARCCGRAGAATASGVMPTSGHTVAMGGIDFGTKLLINGTIYTVEDRGTGYGHVDIFMDSHEAALQFGMQSADVYLIRE